ncbi:MAG: hypothetical protein E5299_00467 [Burkholderia gladioli]|nr:MAG: hypothetical protein E5299_00467 [Burkholderia gladioli]
MQPWNRSTTVRRGYFGSIEAEASRGLAPRMDHSSQYRSDDFRNQIKFLGVVPSYALVAKLQANGVAECFNRTMQEQVIRGHLFKNVEEVRSTVVEFQD